MRLSVQNVVHHFTDLAADPRFRFFGNVTVDKDVSVDELRSNYDAVVLAYGAESDRGLDLPGEVRSSAKAVQPRPGLAALCLRLQVVRSTYAVISLTH